MKKILNSIQKILEDEKLVLEFSKLENSESMYKYLSKLDPKIDKREFEEFTDEIETIYSEYKKKLTEDELEVISGGTKYAPKLPVVVLALASSNTPSMKLPINREGTDVQKAHKNKNKVRKQLNS